MFLSPSVRKQKPSSKYKFMSIRDLQTNTPRKPELLLDSVWVHSLNNEFYFLLQPNGFSFVKVSVVVK